VNIKVTGNLLYSFYLFARLRTNTTNTTNNRSNRGPIAASRFVQHNQDTPSAKLSVLSVSSFCSHTDPE